MLILDRRRSPQALIAQPARCSHCECAVTLFTLDVSLPVARQPVAWMCPYCKATSWADIEGTLAIVTCGHPDPDPDKPLGCQIPLATMKHPRCPGCRLPTGHLLVAVSAAAWVNYYRCENCAHVWVGPKPCH